MGYDGQDRGGPEAYASYYAGMNKSMRQKVALISSYFPDAGVVADMGSGSGQGSFDLANLFPDLKVIGVDINPESVAHSSRTFQRDNLSFSVGDIAAKIEDKIHFTGILNSSVLHHVTSFNDFDVKNLYKLLDNQVEQLEEGGILAIRDFVIPPGPKMVHLDLADPIPQDEESIASLSPAKLFRKFAKEFRSSVYPGSDIPFREQRLDETNIRFTLDLRTATEFILRKDYRADWDSEILEEYTYFSKKEFETELTKRGLKILVSRYIYNPWIIRNRFVNQFQLTDLSGTPLPYPPTNYFIVGQKVTQGTGVMMEESTSHTAAAPQYLKLEHLKNSETGKIWDLVSRPTPAVDIIPWFKKDGKIFVYCRQGHPRPIINAKIDLEQRNQYMASSGYISEPICAAIDALPSGQEVGENFIAKILAERTPLDPNQIVKIEKGQHYFPSAGGINERVQAFYVELRPERQAFQMQSLFDSGFSTSGFIKPLEACQALRAYQVGGMVDSRLELAVYDLLLRHNFNLGPWIGDEISCLSDENSSGAIGEFAIGQLTTISTNPFQISDKPSDFLELRSSDFHELNLENEIIAERTFEYVVPSCFSTRTLSLLPFFHHQGKYWVGMETRILPAPAMCLGKAEILTAPAWRIPFESIGESAAIIFAKKELKKHFKVEASQDFVLGGSYFPSPGITPELVSVVACEIYKSGVSSSPLVWSELSELVNNRNQLEDGHLLTALLRFQHATLSSKPLI